jgi:hypothetical protein
VGDIGLPHRHETVGIGVGKRRPQHAVHDGEHGRRAREADDERQHDDGGESRPPSQRSCGEHQIATEVLDRLDAAETAKRVLDAIDPSEPATCRGGSGASVEPLLLELLGLQRQVQSDLVIEVALGGAAEENGADALQDLRHAGLSTCETAATNASQPRSSRSDARRPCVVSRYTFALRPPTTDHSDASQPSLSRRWRAG